MIYRLRPIQGDTVSVPQVVFAKLGVAEEYHVRVALYVLATGITDPKTICEALKLRSRMTAEAALAFWAGTGLLERYDENHAPGEEAVPPSPMSYEEILSASRTDPMLSGIIQTACDSFGGVLKHSEMQQVGSLYLEQGYQPEVILLCISHVANGKRRNVAALVHELAVWRNEGVETGEQADEYLKLLERRAKREAFVAQLLGVDAASLTLGGKRAIARWYEIYGYDDVMVQEAALQAGANNDLWYWNSILKSWNAKGLRNLYDVRGSGSLSNPVSRNSRVDSKDSSQNDLLKRSMQRPRRLKRKD